MRPSPYMRSVVDRNVVMQRIPVHRVNVIMYVMYICGYSRFDARNYNKE